jgi:hypothetical protein
MRKIHLLSVEDRFELSACGLVVVPILPVPPTVFKQFQAQVTVERPDGRRLEAASIFDIQYHKLLAGDSRCGIVITFRGLSKEDVPIGSRILVDEQIASLWPRREKNST